MIKHIVVWNLADEAEGQDKAANIAEMKRRLDACQGIVPGMITFEVTAAQSGLEASWDMLLYSEFESVEALQAYVVHPTHQEAGTFIRKVVTVRDAFDYDSANLIP